MSFAAFSTRRLVLRAACCAGPLAFASGCVSIGNETPAQLSYELRDLGEQKPLQRAPIDRVALVSWSAASAFYDVSSMVYSRSPGALAYYRFSGWSERPAEQVGRLFVRRLAGTGVFRDVSPISGVVQGSWLVELQLEEMLHDVAVPPGVARIVMLVRIVGRSSRRTIDTRRFREEEPLKTESAEGAAQAFEVAVTRLLDASVQWVAEAALAGRSAPASAGSAPAAASTTRASSAAGR